jgi:hypothetical protein
LIAAERVTKKLLSEDNEVIQAISAEPRSVRLPMLIYKTLDEGTAVHAISITNDRIYYGGYLQPQGSVR